MVTRNAMPRRDARQWKQGAFLALLIGVDLAVSLPIMGATYRPFSWMSIARADVQTLYPVIQEISFEDGNVNLLVMVAPGAPCVLQRSCDPVAGSAGRCASPRTGDDEWADVMTATPDGEVIVMVDTNPVERAVFYRVKQIFDAALSR